LQDRRQLLSYGAFGVLGFGAYRWLSGEKPSEDDAQQISQQQSSAPGAVSPMSLGCMSHHRIAKLMQLVPQAGPLYREISHSLARVQLPKA